MCVYAARNLHVKDLMYLGYQSNMPPFSSKLETPTTLLAQDTEYTWGFNFKTI